ncbi:MULTISPECIES: hypothetical protein [Brenneria]|nr:MULTISPECIES: hypothetical protein [Brenneria]
MDDTGWISQEESRTPAGIVGQEDRQGKVFRDEQGRNGVAG